MFSIRERAIHKLKGKLVPILSPCRRKKLNNTDFTIISNNCWGGICYEYFGLPKLSPTVGCYFYAEDYIKFIMNLQYYLNQPIKIINAKNSKYYSSLKIKGQENVPIGLLNDVEVVFLHYSNPKLAAEKWNRRVKRVNYDNIIIKFSYMNECTDPIIQQFKSISGVKKVLFVGEKIEGLEDAVVLPHCDSIEVKDDTFYWNKYLDVVNLINQPITSLSNLTLGD